MTVMHKGIFDSRVQQVYRCIGCDFCHFFSGAISNMPHEIGRSTSTNIGSLQIQLGFIS